MKVFLSFLLVIICFLCVMNVDSDTGLGQETSFDIMEFIQWFKDNFDNAPDVFFDWDYDEDNFFEKFLGVLADIGALIIYPIRFILWLVPVLIDFVSTFLLPGVSF